jgi:DNA-binding response OmpR family regulator
MATVMVVEDEPDVREFLRDLIEAEGYHVIAMASARRALAVLDEVPVDAIVLDVVMPRDLDGIGFLFQRQRKPHAARIPVLIVSGLGDVINREAARHLGVVGVHPKPLDARELLAQLDRVLSTAAPLSPGDPAPAVDGVPSVARTP